MYRYQGDGIFAHNLREDLSALELLLRHTAKGTYEHNDLLLRIGMLQTQLTIQTGGIT